ncbi:MAG: FeoA family protein [Phycisphaerales bacterium]
MSTSTTLDTLRKGEAARIDDIQRGDARVAQRLLALGLLPGCELTVTAIAPTGDPITVTTSRGIISLRRTEAAGVYVTTVPRVAAS